MTVHFIGAGPGAADLITVRGRDLIRRSPVVLYAGSLVPPGIVAEAGTEAPGDAPRDIRVIDTAAMNLDQIIDQMKAAIEAGHDVARVHSGDPALYGAIAEQMRRLDALGIDYDVTPGVPAYAAAAAALGTELTLPGVSQTVILTRTSVRSSGMPAGEDLATLGQSGATIAIHLSVNNLGFVVRELAPHYGADCPVVVAYRVSWPDERIIRGTLADIRDKVKAADITRTALILVGRVLDAGDFDDSRLYAADHHHVLRPPVIKAPDFPAFWADCVNQGRIDDLIALYHEGAVLMPTFSPHAAKNREELRSYFTLLSSRDNLYVKLHEKTLDCLRTGEQSYVINGIYDFKFSVDGTLQTFPSRFTFVIDLGEESPILHHHSSQIPRTLT